MKHDEDERAAKLKLGGVGWGWGVLLYVSVVKAPKYAANQNQPFS